MQYTNHDSRLSSRIRLLDTDSDRQLARELFELHEKKCTACQEDRLSCTVRPACKNRNFLNMLIELGVEPPDLPAFCYSQYLDQVKRYILERKGRGMDNRRLLIKDLLATLGMGSIKQFTTRFGSLWSKSAKATEQDLLLLAGDGLVFHFDFTRGIVLMNPLDYEIRDFGVFKLYLTLFGNYYSLPVSCRDVTPNWWTMRIDVPKMSPARITKALEPDLTRKFESFRVEIVEDRTHVIVEVIVRNGEPSIMVGGLLTLFSTLATGAPEEHGS
ncbi:MAG: hypothetical protein HXY34_11495 [Candidatus Thorarchaeota archaeon]|nr:hypothetical protein [Candidatus Thorarchaeota archaeon]